MFSVIAYKAGFIVEHNVIYMYHGPYLHIRSVTVLYSFYIVHFGSMQEKVSLLSRIRYAFIFKHLHYFVIPVCLFLFYKIYPLLRLERFLAF